MSARLTPVEFVEDDEFYLAPQSGREYLEEQFNLLKESLLENSLDDETSSAVEKRLKQAANEAAGLAWTTEFPLLVFPTLFQELARRERLNAGRQELIKARTGMFLETV
jgi:hypothetical protein